MKLQEQFEKFRSIGYVTDTEAAGILGIKQNGHLKTTLQNAGLKPVTWKLNGEKGRTVTMWLREEVKQYKDRINKPVAGESNGGKLRQEIAMLKNRVSRLESAMSKNGEKEIAEHKTTLIF